MANHKSSEKRKRQAIKRNAQNKSAKSRMRTSVKKLRLAIEAQNKDEAQTLCQETQSLLGKLCKTSAMKKTTASRKISRLASQVAKIQS